VRYTLVAVVLSVAALNGQADEEPRVRITPDLSPDRFETDWELDGNGGWRVADDVLRLETAGVPGGPIRRPAALAILRSDPLADVVMDVDVRSTAPADLDVRDVLLIFGYQSPSRFYYVHLSRRTDDVHNGIFVVDDADRRRIDDGTGVPRLTDQTWHRVRLERDVATGRIRVYLDDGADPVLAATDRVILSGRVGVGSFDETGEFRSFEISATTAR
jgi:hypothetical protein